MSGVLVANTLLRAASGVTDLVPGARICRGFIPVGTPLPAIAITSISDNERMTASMAEAERIVTERVQVTAKAANHAQAGAVIAAAREALGHRTGAVGEVSVVSILPAGAGPDLYEADGAIHTRSVDVMVTWRR